MADHDLAPDPQLLPADAHPPCSVSEPAPQPDSVPAPVPAPAPESVPPQAPPPELSADAIASLITQAPQAGPTGFASRAPKQSRSVTVKKKKKKDDSSKPNTETLSEDVQSVTQQDDTLSAHDTTQPIEPTKPSTVDQPATATAATTSDPDVAFQNLGSPSPADNMDSSLSSRPSLPLTVPSSPKKSTGTNSKSTKTGTSPNTDPKQTAKKTKKRRKLFEMLLPCFGSTGHEEEPVITAKRGSNKPAAEAVQMTPTLASPPVVTPSPAATDSPTSVKRTPAETAKHLRNKMKKSAHTGSPGRSSRRTGSDVALPIPVSDTVTPAGAAAATSAANAGGGGVQLPEDETEGVLSGAVVPPGKEGLPKKTPSSNRLMARSHSHAESLGGKPERERGAAHEEDSLSGEEDEDEEEEPSKNGGRTHKMTEEEREEDVRLKETGRWDGQSDDDSENDDNDKPLPLKAPNKTRKENNGMKDTELASDKKGSTGFFASAEGASFSANSFVELNLSRPLLRACESLGYKKPTPIQAACIPLALTGRDICGSAITGSGKTAAFALPVLERLLYRPRRIPAIRVLILTPTRELAVQVHSMTDKIAQFTDIRSCLVVGGLSTKAQESALRSRPDIVVATPGRMIDHLHNAQSVGLEELAVLILDEADRLLELGFSSEVQELVKLCPKRRQTMLFSATMTEEVDELIKLSLTSPVRLSADPLTKRPSTLTEEVIKIRPVHEAKHEAILLALCSRTFTSKAIIFSGTKQAAHRLKILFGLSDLKAAELHGNLTQAQRLDALEQFRKQEVDFLIATDVAARGLDIIGVQTVINFACPRDITSYVHRVGRTARAGKEGCAITFVTERDRRLLKAMAKRAGSKLLSRVVAEQSIAKWCQNIEQMEDDVASIIQEEREERALRKAEMEANKAQNMVEHKDEIYSRPKRTWFESERDKKRLAKASKASEESTKATSVKKVTSVQEADDFKRKEKRRLEYEKNLPRKKRRKLEAARQMQEEDEENNNDHVKGSENGNGEKVGKSVVELAYRRAKAVKAAEKSREAGKLFKKAPSKKLPREKGRKEEMEDLFQGDMSAKKQRNTTTGGSLGGGGKKKSNKAFKSKSRYKRRK